MKMLFTSPEGPEVGLLKSVLDQAGIASEVRNDNSYASFAAGTFCPELWVLNEADYARAVELRDDWCKTSVAEAPVWICPACGEKSDGQFVACWKCGTARTLVS